MKQPPAARRRQHERTAASTAKLIDATIACVNELSFARTTTTHIAKQAGLSRGALQHHFATREDLLLAVWSAIQGRFLELFDEPFPTGASMETLTARLLERLWALYRSPAYLASIEIRLGVRSEPTLHHAIEQDMQRFNEIYELRWQELFSPFASKDAIEECRRVIGGALRGLALLKMQEHDETYYERTLDMCRDMMVSYLDHARLERAEP